MRRAKAWWALRRQGLWVGVLLAATFASLASAETAGVTHNVRSGGIDSHQRDEPGSAIRRSRAVGLVKAPVDEVTKVVLDYGGYRRFMPHFSASRVLSQRGHRALVYVAVEALGGVAKLWMEMDIRMLPADESDTRIISAKMIKGNVKSFQAQWHVTPHGPKQTLVAFELCGDPDFPIPFADSLVSDYNEIEARSSVLALRRFIGARGASAAR